MMRLIVLLSINLALAVAVGLSKAPEDPPLPPPSSTPPRSAQALRDGREVAPATPIRQIGHPLFASMPRPAGSRPERTEVTATSLPTIRLLGTAIDADLMIAVVSVEPGPSVKRVGVGDEIGIWRVRRIDRRGVDFIAMDATGRRMRIDLDPPNGRGER